MIRGCSFKLHGNMAVISASLSTLPSLCIVAGSTSCSEPLVDLGFSMTPLLSSGKVSLTLCSRRRFLKQRTGQAATGCCHFPRVKNWPRRRLQRSQDRLQAQIGSQPWASYPGIAISEAPMKSAKSTFSLQDLSENLEGDLIRSHLQLLIIASCNMSLIGRESN